MSGTAAQQKTALDEIVVRLVDALRPTKIVLFGSRARGDHRADSDLDLLVIMDSPLRRERRAAEVYNALIGAHLDTDIQAVVYTPEEIEQWKDVPAALVTTALREGKVLYEQEHP